MKKSTKVIASSVLSIAMCATLITGSTFALFTGHDEENISVTSGNVAVAASVTNLTGFSALWDESAGTYEDNFNGPVVTNTNDGTFTNKGTWKYDTGDGAGKLELTNISPGDGVKFNLSITNTSTIKIQYRAQLVVNADEETDPTRKDANKALLSAMKVTFGDGSEAVGQTIGSSSMIATKWTMVETIPGKDSPATYTVPVRIELPITNADQNAYQGASCSFSVGVYAIQANANVSDPPEAAFIIYTPQDFVSLSEEVNGGITFEKKTVALANDIYLDGSASRTAARLSAYVLADALADTTATTFAPIGTADHPFKGTFDGHGHTIYNFTAQTSTEGSSNAGLFGVTENAAIKDVIFANATVEAESGTSAAGVLVGTAKGSLSVSNVTVKESTVTAAEEGANLGALVGKTEGDATVTVENVNVQMNESDAEFNGKNELVDGANPSVQFTGGETNEAVFELCDGFIERITYTNDGTQKLYEVSSAEGLRYFAKTVNGELDGIEPKNYAGETVVLMNDIDLKNEAWLPIGCYKRQYPNQPNKEQLPFEGNFDGDNHIISNLRMYALEDGWGGDNYYGLFGRTQKPAEGSQEIKNLTIQNVEMPAPKKYDPANSDTWHGNHNNVHYIGALVGLATGTSFSNVHLKGNIYLRANSYVGGLIGEFDPDTNSVLSDLSVEGDGLIWAGNRAGGIIGSVNYSLSGAATLQLNTIKVSGVVTRAQTQFNGGVIGELVTSHSTKTIEVTIDGVQLDAVHIQPYNISNDNAKKTVGAVVGGYGKEVTSIAIRNVTGTAFVENDPDHPTWNIATMLNSGIIGKNINDEANSHVHITDCDDLTVYWYGLKVIDGGYKAETKEALLTLANNWSSFAFNNETKPFVIELAAGETYDLSDVVWPGLGQVTHLTFKGNNAVIKNMNTGDARTQAGFFNNVGDATISDLTIENGTVTGDQAGILAGHGAQLRLSNVTLTGNFDVAWKDVDGEEYPGIGVLVGAWGDQVDTSSYSDVTIAAETKVFLGGSPEMEKGVTAKNGKLFMDDTNRLLGYDYTGTQHTLPAGITVTEGAEITYGYIVTSGDELVSAIAGVNAGGANLIKLGGDVTYEGSNRSSSKKVLRFNNSVILDLNGKTLLITSTNGYDYLEFYGESSNTTLDVTIKSSVEGGKIEQDKIYAASTYGVIKTNYSDLTMDGVTINYTGGEAWPQDPMSAAKVYALSFAERSEITINNCEINGNVFLGSGPNLTATNSKFNGSWDSKPTGTATLNRCELSGEDTDRFETSRVVTITDSIVKVDMYVSTNGAIKVTGGTVESDVTFSNGTKPDFFNATGTTFKGDRFIGAGEGNVRECVLTDCIFEGGLSIDVVCNTRNNITLDNCTINGKLTATQQSRVKLTNGTTYQSKEGEFTEVNS